MDLLSRGHLYRSSADRKLTVLDTISSSFLLSPDSIIDFFYNFDACTGGGAIYVNLVEACVNVGSSQVVKEWHRGRCNFFVFVYHS